MNGQFKDFSPQPPLEDLRTAHLTVPSNAYISQVDLPEETTQSQRTTTHHRSCTKQRRRKLMCLKSLLHGEGESDKKAKWQGEEL